jgi:hypothetical protein
MVDRVAAMLNYFLCHLVGPKKKNFKVSITNKTVFKSYFSYFPSIHHFCIQFFFYYMLCVIFESHDFIKISSMGIILLC